MNRKKISQRLLSLLLCAAMLCSVLAACQKQEETPSQAESSAAPSSSEPASSEDSEDMTREFDESGFFHTTYTKDGAYTITIGQDDMVTFHEGDELPALADLTQEDFSVNWTKVTWPEVTEDMDADEAEALESTVEQRTAAITAFENSGDSINLTFADAEAQENVNLYYDVIIKDGAALVPVIIDVPEYELSADVEEVSSNIEELETTISLHQGNFNPDTTPADITLGNSFQEMTVADVSVNGSYMTLSLTGSPVLEPDITTVYMDGEIRLEAGAFLDTPYSNSVYIAVTAPMAGVDLSELEDTGSAVTFPVELAGVDPADVTAADISFDGEGTVTDIKVEGDKVLVTVTPDSGDTADLSGDLTVGDASVAVGVTHAAVEAVFDMIEQEGDDLIITLSVKTLNGSFAESFGPDSFTLENDFEGGSVEQAVPTHENRAQVRIRFPRGDMTEEDYGILGTFTLAEGALLDENGSPAPAFTFTRQFIPEEMGRDLVDTGITVAGYVVEIDGLFINKDVQNVFKDTYNYGKSLYGVVSSAMKGEWGDVFSGAKSFLQLIGLIDAGEDTSVSNEQLLEEIRTTQKMLSEMSDKLDENTKQTYQNRLTPFETAIGVLDSDCALIEAKLQQAQLDLEEQGVHNYMEKEITVQKEEPVYGYIDGPEIYVNGVRRVTKRLVQVGTKIVEVGEVIKVPFDDEQASQYMDQLIDYCEAQEKAGNKDFKNFTNTMNELEAKFKEVAVEAAKTGGSSPFYAYDSYWDLYFNFHSQSYFLRAGYYANCDTQLKRGYNLLATYYNIPAHQASYQALTDAFNKAVKTIEARPLGRNPQDNTVTKSIVDNLTPTYCLTLKRNVKYVGIVGDWPMEEDQNSMIWYDTNLMKDFVKRLHGRTIEYDLITSGLWPNKRVTNRNKQFNLTETLGLGYSVRYGYNTSWESWPHYHYQGYSVMYMDWNGNGPHYACYYDEDPDDSDHNYRYWAFFHW